MLRDKTKDSTNLFGNVFNTEDINNVPYCEDKYTGKPLSTIVFTPEMIQMKLLGINGNKSPGPDSIDPFMIKYPAEPLSKPFSILFNKCINK